MTENAMPPRSNRRRTLVVDRTRQRRIVLRITWLPVTFLVVGAIVTMVFTGRVMAEVRDIAADVPSLMPAAYTVLLLLVAAGTAMVVHAHYYSHGVVGPLRRLEAGIRALRSGDWNGPLVLRATDELCAVAEELNRLAEQVLEQSATDDGAGERETEVVGAPGSEDRG